MRPFTFFTTDGIQHLASAGGLGVQASSNDREQCSRDVGKEYRSAKLLP